MLRAVTVSAALCAGVVAVIACESAKAVSLSPGDILVVNNSMAGASIVRIDPVTGDRAVVSGLYLDEQNQTVEVGAGRSIREAYGVDIDPQGRIVVAVTELSASNDPLYGIVRIDPATGDREVIAEFPDATLKLPALQAKYPYDVTVDSTGQLYVSLFDDFGQGRGALVRIPYGAESAVLVAQPEDAFANYYGLFLDEANGRLLTANALLPDHHPAAITSIDLAMGSETTISGRTIRLGADVGVGPSSRFVDVVMTADGRLFGLGDRVYSIDPATGDRSVSPPGHAVLNSFWRMAWEPATGGFLLTTPSFPTVARIDGTTGELELLSGTFLQEVRGAGPGLVEVRGIVVVPNPIPEPTAGVLIAVGAIAIAAMRQRSKRPCPLIRG